MCWSLQLLPLASAAAAVVACAFALLSSSNLADLLLFVCGALAASAHALQLVQLLVLQLLLHVFPNSASLSVLTCCSVCCCFADVCTCCGLLLLFLFCLVAASGVVRYRMGDKCDDVCAHWMGGTIACGFNIGLLCVCP